MTNLVVSMPHKMTAAIMLVSIASLFFLCLTGPFMNMSDMSSGMPCGMDHATQLCPLVLSDHLGFWQKILVPISSSASLLSLIVALAGIVISLQDTATQEGLRRSKYLRYHAGAAPPLLDYLQQHFSQGILHPKIY